MAASSPKFLLWYEDQKGVPIAKRIAHGVSVYTARFRGVAPRVVLVSEADAADLFVETTIDGLTVDGLEVIAKSYVRRNNYWLGQEAPE